VIADAVSSLTPPASKSIQDCPTNSFDATTLPEHFVHLCYTLASLFYQIYHQKQLILPVTMRKVNMKVQMSTKSNRNMQRACLCSTCQPYKVSKAQAHRSRTKAKGFVIDAICKKLEDDDQDIVMRDVCAVRARDRASQLTSAWARLPVSILGKRTRDDDDEDHYHVDDDAVTERPSKRRARPSLPIEMRWLHEDQLVRRELAARREAREARRTIDDATESFVSGFEPSKTVDDAQVTAQEAKSSSKLPIPDAQPLRREPLSKEALSKLDGPVTKLSPQSAPSNSDLSSLDSAQLALNESGHSEEVTESSRTSVTPAWREGKEGSIACSEDADEQYPAAKDEWDQGNVQTTSAAVALWIEDVRIAFAYVSCDDSINDLNASLKHLTCKDTFAGLHDLARRKAKSLPCLPTISKIASRSIGTRPQSSYQLSKTKVVALRTCRPTGPMHYSSRKEANALGKDLAPGDQHSLSRMLDAITTVFLLERPSTRHHETSASGLSSNPSGNMATTLWQAQAHPWRPVYGAQESYQTTLRIKIVDVISNIRGQYRSSSRLPIVELLLASEQIQKSSPVKQPLDLVRYYDPERVLFMALCQHIFKVCHDGNANKLVAHNEVVHERFPASVHDAENISSDGKNATGIKAPIRSFHVIENIESETSSPMLLADELPNVDEAVISIQGSGTTCSDHETSQQPVDEEDSEPTDAHQPTTIAEPDSPGSSTRPLSDANIDTDSSVPESATPGLSLATTFISLFRRPPRAQLPPPTVPNQDLTSGLLAGSPILAARRHEQQFSMRRWFGYMATTNGDYWEDELDSLDETDID
jgi:hypothetical protein